MTLRAADPDIKILVLGGLPAGRVLELYENMSGQKIAASAEALADKTPVSLKIEKKTKAEALALIEQALVQQTTIEIIHASDGSLSATKRSAKK